MRFELTAPQKKMFALALLLALLGAVYGLLVDPLLGMYRDNRERIASLESRLAGYRQVAGNGSALRKALAERLGAVREADYFLRNDKHALASAELQELVRAKIRESGGRLVSSQAYDVSEMNGRESVSIDARLQGDIGVLQSFLYQLANSRPMVFVDELAVTSIRSRAVGRVNAGANNEERLLDVRIKMSAYLRSSSPGV